MPSVLGASLADCGLYPLLEVGGSGKSYRLMAITFELTGHQGIIRGELISDLEWMLANRRLERALWTPNQLMAISYHMSRPISAESVFRAIAHPSRRRMLELISRREWAACELADQFHHAQPTISNHLRILDQARLIQCERRGRMLMYGLCPGALGAVAQWLAQFPASAIKASRKG